jgi:hypothetical protein
MPLAVFGEESARPAVRAGTRGARDDVLVDLPGHADPAGHAVDVRAPELEQLALPQTDEGGEHDEELQSLGHRSTMAPTRPFWRS